MFCMLLVDSRSITWMVVTQHEMSLLSISDSVSGPLSVSMVLLLQCFLTGHVVMSLMLRELQLHLGPFFHRKLISH